MGHYIKTLKTPKTLVLILFIINIIWWGDSLADYTVKTQCDKVINYHLYDICYNYKLKNAEYSSYYLDKNIVSAPSLKKRPGFHMEHHISKKYAIRSSDYSHTGYDKGHLAPNAALDVNKSLQRELFTLANVSPQAPGLNRRAWKQLEKYVFNTAKTHDIFVITGVCYTNSAKRVGKLLIPYGFFKIINYNDIPKSELYFMKNIKQTKNISAYKSTPAKINSICTNIKIVKKY